MFIDPAARRAELQAAQERGERPALCAFYGHYARRAEPGPWVLSQWWPVRFTVDGVSYRHAEGFMMAAKARLFGDAEALERILTADSPKEAKALGLAVRGFVHSVWDAHAYGLVVEGNLAKFGQHPNLAAFLASTAPAVLVEASPTDRIWGVGLRAGDPRVAHVASWRGRNLLGFALTEVRERLTT